MKTDLILLGGFLLSAFLFRFFPFLLNKLNNNLPAAVAVYMDVQRIADYSLREDQTLAIPWEEEYYNLLLIENG